MKNSLGGIAQLGECLTGSQEVTGSSPVISTIVLGSDNGFGQPLSELFRLPEPSVFGSGLYFGHYADLLLSDSISPAIRLAAFALAFLTAWV